MTEENRLKISSPERVARIISRICEASLPVMIRCGGASTVMIKGRATQVILDTASPGIRISSISEKGIEHLEVNAQVQVEFVMMSTKVMFMTQIVRREPSSILIKLPTSLVSVERRKNARYACREDMMAFLDLSLWKPKFDDLIAPPFFLHHQNVAGYINVADLSFGGLCAVTRFPAITVALKRGTVDEQAKLILPMQEPLAVGIEIRWFKRIREHVKTKDKDDQAYMRTYRFGISFIQQSEQVRVSVRQFIQKLSQADAI